MSSNHKLERSSRGDRGGSPPASAATAEAPPAEIAPGDLINNRYRVSRKLGSGGMGSVYLVVDTWRGDCPLAMKRVRRDRVDSRTITILRNEFLALSPLSHPNLARVYDFEVDLSTQDYFFTSEFVDGFQLLKAAKDFRIQRPADFQRFLEALVQIARALEFIHSRGLVHGDIKPENLLVSGPLSVPEGQEGPPAPIAVKMIDFGLTKREKEFGGKRIVGTAYYIAPETILGSQIDRRTDLYSLGVLLYQISTHKLPFTGDTNLAVLRGHIEKAPTPPSMIDPAIPEPLSRMILRLMEKQPVSRYPTALDLIAELNRSFGTDFPLETPETLVSYVRSGSFIGREGQMAELAGLFESVYRAEKPVETDDELDIPSIEGPGLERLTRMVGDLPPPPKGRMVLVRGEPGVGKRQLLKEFRRFVQTRGVHYIEIDCGARGPDACRSFAELVHAQVGILSARDPGEAPDRERLESFLKNLERTTVAPLALRPAVDKLAAKFLTLSRETPLVLAFIEIQRGDGMLLEFLRSIVSRNAESSAQEAQLMVVATADEEDPDDTFLRPFLLSGEIRSLIREVSLSRFSLEEVNRQIASMFGAGGSGASGPPGESLPRLVHEESDGNPGVAEEIVEHLVLENRIHRTSAGWTSEEAIDRERLPRKVRAELRERIDRLDPVTRRLAVTLALLGGEGELEVATRLAGIPPGKIIQAVLSLKRERIIREEPGESNANRYSFVHSSAREILYQQIPESERSARHDRAGAMLEAHFKASGKMEPRLLAYHFLRAGNAAAALRHGLDAAREWEGLHDPRKAIEIFRELRPLLPPDDQERRARIVRSLVRLHSKVGEYAAAVEILREQAGYPRPAAGPVAVVATASLPVPGPGPGPGPGPASLPAIVPLSLPAVPSAIVPAPVPSTTPAEGAASAAATSAPSPASLSEASPAAIASAAGAPPAGASPGVLPEKPPEAAASPAGASPAIRPALEGSARTAALIPLGEILARLGDFREAGAALGEAHVLLKNSGSTAELSSLLLGFATLFHHRGRFGESLRYCEKVLSWEKRLEDPELIIKLHLLLSDNYFRLDNKEIAAKHCQRALECLSSNQTADHLALTLQYLGKFYAYRGRFQKALRLLEQCAAVNHRLSVANGEAECEREIGRIQQILDRPQEALAHLNRAVAIYEKTGDLPGVMESVNLRAEQYRVLGLYDEAQRDLKRSIQGNGAVGSIQLAAESCLASARVAHDQGNGKRLEAYLTEGERCKEGQLGDRVPLNVLVMRLELETERGNFVEALDLSARGLLTAREIGSRLRTAPLLEAIVRLYLTLGRHAEARRHLTALIEIGERYGLRAVEGRAALLEAMLMAREQQLDEAGKRFEVALRSFREERCERDLITTYTEFGKLQLAVRNHEYAYLFFEEGLYLAKKLGLVRAKCHLFHQMGLLEALVPEGIFAKAVAYFSSAERAARSIPLPDLLWRIQADLGRYYLAASRHLQANGCLSEALEGRRRIAEAIPEAFRQGYLDAAGHRDLEAIQGEARSRSEIQARRERVRYPERNPTGDFYFGLDGRSPARLALYRELAALPVSGPWVWISGEPGSGRRQVAAAVHRQSSPEREKAWFFPAASFRRADLTRFLKDLEKVREEVPRLVEKGASGGEEVLACPARYTLLLADAERLEPAVQEALLERVLAEKEREDGLRVVATISAPPGEPGALAGGAPAKGALIPALIAAGFPAIRVPPFSDWMQDDLPLLVERILQQKTASPGAARQEPPRLEEEGLELLRKYPFAGQLREFREILEKLHRLGSPGGTISVEAVRTVLTPTLRASRRR